MTPGPVSDSYPGPPDGSPLDTPICIVFSGSAPNLRFVEVETADGKGLGVGEWGTHCRNSDLSILTITPRSILKGLGLDGEFEVLNCAFCGFEYVGPDKPIPRDRLEAHIRECEKHPARELVQLLTDIEIELRASYRAVADGGDPQTDLTPELTTRVMEADRRWSSRDNAHRIPLWPKELLDRLVEVTPIDPDTPLSESPTT